MCLCGRREMLDTQTVERERREESEACFMHYQRQEMDEGTFIDDVTGYYACGGDR